MANSRENRIYEFEDFRLDAAHLFCGAQLCFVARGKGDRQYSLYRVPTLGDAPTHVSTSINSPVSFSPDGKEMVFGRWNEETSESAFVIAASDGSHERVFQVRGKDEEFLGNPAWSPDGSATAFCAAQPQVSTRIIAVNLQTGERTPLSSENGTPVTGPFGRATARA